MSYQIQSLDGTNYLIDESLWQRCIVEKALLLRYFALPLKENETTLWLGVDDFTNMRACETFAFLQNKRVEPVLIDRLALKSALQHLSPQVDLINDDTHSVYQSERLENEQRDEPIIQLINTILKAAIDYQASDIHCDPNQQGMTIRLRVDGILQIYQQLSLSIAQRVISRLKLLASLDISETRLPQDGRFEFKTDFKEVLDLRIAVLPTILGEKVVLRVQKNQPVTFTFTALGMTSEQEKTLSTILRQPQGLILVTGPTGSGKTISLYTILNYLNSIDKHILTAEDPVEIILPGIIQTQVNTALNIDFTVLLKNFLRQDPDIIMLGEIRDEDSARMAIRAAQTGHLVLSTLHTNDAPSAITRLQQFGIQPYEISHSLLLVIAQRLLRKQYVNTSTNNSKRNGPNELPPNPIYQGRIGIYQFLTLNSAEHLDYQLDYATLIDSGLVKVKQGVTDKAELLRVLGYDPQNKSTSYA